MVAEVALIAMVRVGSNVKPVVVLAYVENVKGKAKYGAQIAMVLVYAQHVKEKNLLNAQDVTVREYIKLLQNTH